MTLTGTIQDGPPPVDAGSARYLAWLFTPQEARARVAALFALEHEVLSPVRTTVEHDIVHARLGWWQDELQALAGGRPRHPLGIALAQQFGALALSPPDLRGLIDIAQRDLACSAFETGTELQQYRSSWVSGLFRNVALSLCPALSRRADVERFSAAGGTAIRDVELVRQLASSARRGRVHVVLRANPDGPTSHQPWVTQPWSSSESSVLSLRLREQRSAIIRACTALPVDCRPPLRPLLAWSAIALRVAGRCLNALPHELNPTRMDALASHWAGWRAAVAAGRGRLPSSLQETP